jgi:hypothetical protein
VRFALLLRFEMTSSIGLPLSSCLAAADELMSALRFLKICFLTSNFLCLGLGSLAVLQNRDSVPEKKGVFQAI